ncbi:MAG: site-specific DNA-methyltransferase [Phycisphaerales bacterium]
MPSLHFKGKSAVETYHHTVPHHTLQFVKKLSVLGKGQEPSLDGNLIIEGDNLLALKALLPTHAGKVKCVYIDPPYNTGNEGWVYNDNLTQPQFKEWIGQTVGKEGEDFCRHDKWCCMMYPRLQLLRELLSEDGIILVSIDDNEATHLRLLMDEIFGNGTPGDAEANYVGTICWKTRNTDNRIKTNLSIDHEYVAVYRKSNLASLSGRTIDRSSFDNPDNDPRGPYTTDPLLGMATSQARPNLHYNVTNPDTGEVYEPDPSRGWRIDKAAMKKLIESNSIWWPSDPNTGNPRKKRFLSEASERMPESTFWADIRGQSGADELDQILGKRMFDFPKLEAFVSRLLDIACPQDSLVLDCTAGSGTTGHAVLRLNQADGGTRKFILVQQKYDTKDHEKDKFNIAERVTRERLAKAIGGYSYTKPKRGGGSESIKVAGLGGTFTYTRVSPKPLLGDYRDLGDELPSYDEIAAYVFYTETSAEWKGSDRRKNKAFDAEARKIGEHGGRSYYLLYEPNDRLDTGIDATFLKEVAAKDPNAHLVVYAEKIWVHRDQLRAWEHEHGKFIRPMIVPFNLK